MTRPSIKHGTLLFSSTAVAVAVGTLMLVSRDDDTGPTPIGPVSSFEHAENHLSMSEGMSPAVASSRSDSLADAESKLLPIAVRSKTGLPIDLVFIDATDGVWQPILAPHGELPVESLKAHLSGGLFRVAAPGHESTTFDAVPKSIELDAKFVLRMRAPGLRDRVESVHHLLNEAQVAWGSVVGAQDWVIAASPNFTGILGGQPVESVDSRPGADLAPFEIVLRDGFVLGIRIRDDAWSGEIRGDLDLSLLMERRTEPLVVEFSPRELSKAEEHFAVELRTLEGADVLQGADPLSSVRNQPWGEISIIDTLTGMTLRGMSTEPSVVIAKALLGMRYRLTANVVTQSYGIEELGIPTRRAAPIDFVHNGAVQRVVLEDAARVTGRFLPPWPWDEQPKQGRAFFDTGTKNEALAAKAKKLGWKLAAETAQTTRPQLFKIERDGRFVIYAGNIADDVPSLERHITIEVPGAIAIGRDVSFSTASTVELGDILLERKEPLTTISPGSGLVLDDAVPIPPKFAVGHLYGNAWDSALEITAVIFHANGEIALFTDNSSEMSFEQPLIADFGRGKVLYLQSEGLRHHSIVQTAPLEIDVAPPLRNTSATLEIEVHWPEALTATMRIDLGSLESAGNTKVLVPQMNARVRWALRHASSSSARTGESVVSSNRPTLTIR